MKEKRKLRDKMALNMIIPGDTMQVTDDLELFNIKKIKKKNVSFEAVQVRGIPFKCVWGVDGRKFFEHPPPYFKFSGTPCPLFQFSSDPPAPLFGFCISPAEFSQ